MKTLMIFPFFAMGFCSWIYGASSEGFVKKFQLSSNAFENNGRIPKVYTATRQGKNLSPPLKWENPPDGTKSFALLVEDIDVPMFGTIPHWIIFNIPAEEEELPEGIPHRTHLFDGSIQGKNIYFQNGYLGPSPPFGEHRYVFRIYALDTVLDPNPRVTRKKFLKIIEKHVIATAQLTGTYANDK